MTAGRIVETEAYLGPDDAASHAAFRPGSHPLFYGEGGFAYVYLIYGLHACLNAIAERAGRPGCVLIRALEPLAGVGAMARRRGVAPDARTLASGPGNVTRLLGEAFQLRFEHLDSTYHVGSGEEYWQVFSSSYGPTKTLAESLEPDRRGLLQRDWREFFEREYRREEEIVHPREYLLVLGTRR